MSSRLTPKEATAFACPLARVHGGGKEGKCRAVACILWRWLPLPAGDPSYMAAVKREEACLAQDAEKETGKPQNSEKFHKKAVANVGANPTAYNVKPKHGYCGLGGKPEQ